MSILTVVLVALIVIAAVWLVVAGVELVVSSGDWVHAALVATGVVVFTTTLLAAGVGAVLLIAWVIGLGL